MSTIYKVKVGSTTYDLTLPQAIADLFKLSGDESTNLTISSNKHMNFEPLEGTGDIQFKPGDDVVFYSHHRASGKQDEVHLSVFAQKADATGKDADIPTKLQVNMSALTLTTKDKEDSTNDPDEVLDVNINTGKTGTNDNTKGYLKVRARAIDLRCEEHGGIALQPKGKDSDGMMNKIKFEHGGGDGLEFGTFNTEKTSLFTDEYRFNKDGVVKMATRTKQTSDKADASDATTAYKYKKNTYNTTAEGCEAGDDFYDFIKTSDEQTTWKDIIKTSNALNTHVGMHTKINDKGNMEIVAEKKFKVELLDELPDGVTPVAEYTTAPSDVTDGYYDKSDLDTIKDCVTDETTEPQYVAPSGTGTYYKITYIESPQIHIASDGDVELESADDDVKLTAGDAVKIDAPEIKLEAGADGINFGATAALTFLTKNFTKGCNVESADEVYIKMGVHNNFSKTVYLDLSSVFHVPVDRLYTDAAHTTPLTPTASSGTAVYLYDGTQVTKDSKYWFAYTEDGVTGYYLLETKSGSGVIKNNGITKVASSGDSYIRTVKDEATSTYYYPSAQFEAYDYAGGTGLTAIESDAIVASGDAIKLSDITNLVAYAKTQGWIL